MWLVCRLDKNSLRPAELRFGGKGSRPAPAPESEAIGEIGTA
jgi:hypothetical protein